MSRINKPQILLKGDGAELSIAYDPYDIKRYRLYVEGDFGAVGAYISKELYEMLRKELAPNAPIIPPPINND